MIKNWEKQYEKNIVNEKYNSDKVNMSCYYKGKYKIVIGFK
jgi:hypothetical protein